MTQNLLTILLEAAKTERQQSARDYQTPKLEPRHLLGTLWRPELSDFVYLSRSDPDFKPAQTTENYLSSQKGKLL